MSEAAVYLCGTLLPDRPNSHRNRRSNHSEHGARREPYKPREKNAIGVRMDALGISSPKLAALLACRHGIPANSRTVALWTHVDGNEPRDKTAASAIAFELGMSEEEVMAAWENE